MSALHIGRSFSEIVTSTDQQSGSVTVERYTTPDNMLADSRFLLGAAAFRSATRPVGQFATVILDEDINWQPALDQGWEHVGLADHHWRHFRRDGLHVYVLVLSLYRQGATADSKIMHDVFALASWERFVGTPYHQTAGVSALTSLRASYDGAQAQPRWRLMDTNRMLPWEPPARIAEQDYRTHQWRPTVASGQWDMRGAYLAAMAAVQLPFRELQPTGPDPTTRKCGYYRVRADKARFPSWVWPAGIDRKSTAWVCQGTLELVDPKGELEILDSYTPAATLTTTGHKRLLRPWAESWRDIIAAAGQEQSVISQGPLKWAYAEMIGLMGKPGGTVFRPDWRHMIIDQARASLARRILRAGAWGAGTPIRINRDAVFYKLPDDQDAAEKLIHTLHELLGVGSKIGNMTFKGIGPWPA